MTMLDGNVRYTQVMSCEVYDLKDADGPRGRGEASVVSGEILPDRDGVVARFHGVELLIPTAVIKAAEKIAGKE